MFEALDRLLSKMLKEDFVCDFPPLDELVFEDAYFWLKSSSIFISKSRAFNAEDGTVEASYSYCY